jgi:hypothetical protein
MPERISEMRGRRKFQNPRPKKVKVDGVQYWRLQFRDIDGRPRTKSLGRVVDLSYREADEKARDILEPVNAATEQSIRKSQITIAQFVTQVVTVQIPLSSFLDKSRRIV